MSLDVPSSQFQQWVEKAGSLITQYHNDRENGQVFAGKTPSEVQSLLDEPLPQTPRNMDQLLQEVVDKVYASATHSAGPRYFGYITGGGNQAAVIAEMIKASLNQNNLKWHSSPVSTEMEKLVMRWVAEFIGYPAESAGVLLSGGSVANYHALAVARKARAPGDIRTNGMYGMPPMAVYVSEEGHSSFDKAMDMLGLGMRYLRKIPTDGNQQIIPELLEDQIKKDREEGVTPICVIGVAGTTNTGALDNLDALAAICKERDLWFHVDAAYGGPAARLPEKAPLFSGMTEADSVVINPHKWFYVPFEAGGLLVKNPETLRAAFSTIPDYLKSDATGKGRTDLMEYNLPLTKEFRALKVWMTLKVYGARRITQAIQNDIDKAAYLAKRIDEEKKLERLAPVNLSVVCFRYNPGTLSEEQLNRLNERMINAIEQDGEVFLTGTKIKGDKALRVCFINHRTEKSDLDLLIDVVLNEGRKGNF